MVAWLSQWLQNIILIVLLATFADLLLPSSTLQKYSKMVLGLLVIVAILSPILELFTKDYPFNEFIKKLEAEMNRNQVVSAMNSEANLTLNKDNEQQMIQNVEQSMTEHLRGILEKEFNFTVTKVSLQAELRNQNWQINSASVYLKESDASNTVIEAKQEKEVASIATIETVEITVNNVKQKAPEEIVNSVAQENKEFKKVVSRIEEELGLKEGQVTVFLN